MKKNKRMLSDMGPKNIASNPSYVEQVLGYIQNIAEGKEFYIAKKLVRDSKKLGDGIVNTRVTDFMKGLDIISIKEERKDVNGTEVIGKIELKPSVDILSGYLKNSKIRFTPGEDGQKSDVFECFSKMKACNENVYFELRKIFLDSVVYEVVCDYLDENNIEGVTQSEFRNDFWTKINNLYGNPKEKEGGKKEDSATSGENNCPSLENWLEMFGMLRKSKVNKTNLITIGRDVNDIVKRHIEGDKKQIIFNGAPGTGKTFSVREYVKKNSAGRYKFIQFHSSYDYTDFVEGIRPVPKVGSDNSFVRMDGVFKKFCREIVNANCETVRKSNIDGISTGEGVSYEKTLSECIKILNPDLKNENAEKLKEVINAFEKYYFVIDEINRADLSKVFGELMFGLEEGYRGVSNRFETQYYNLPTYEMIINDDGKKVAVEIADDCFEQGFFIPSNLYIIGTMNDIDRSVESFDFALRRRFDWAEIKANDVMKMSLMAMKKTDGVTDKLAENIIEMNELLSESDMGLGSEYHIGPAYFKDYKSDDDNMDFIFFNRIKPLLKEYLRGRDQEQTKELIEECEKILNGKE